MGINKQTLKMFLNENNYKKITGDFLCIGKQTVNVDPFATIKLFEKYGCSSTKLKNLYSNKKYDTLTRHAKDIFMDEDLLSCFSDAKYNCLDRSSYEGASIIHDMNTPISDNLHQKFDFIYNGSCMDNLFDPVSFIRNTSNMLKVGGRILHIECATGVPGAYIMYSPEWFFSYYAINNYIDCKVYVSVARSEGTTRHIFDTDLFIWQPFFNRQKDYSDIKACKSINGLMHLIVIAEKGRDSTSNLCPIQMQYLDENTIDWRQKYYDFNKSERPIIKLDQKIDVVVPYLTDHYKYLGSGF